MAGLEQLLASREIAVFAGSGGVGKTTTAAATALMASTHLGGKVLVLTVDPARRLANAMGLRSFGNIETPVPAEAFEAAGIRPRGQLWAAMLDTKASWDDLVRRHAPDPRTRDRILANPLYENISGRFVQSHDYIAMERLHEIHSSGRYDLVVVDTPPTRNALDLLEAPERMAEFFTSRLLRLLTAPSRSRLLTLASRPFYEVADRILGSQFLGDISEFFSLFQTMEAGFIERARAVQRVLTDRRTTFAVVTTLEAAPVAEADFFIDELVRGRHHVGAVIMNRTLPQAMLAPSAAGAADIVRERSDELAAALLDGPDAATAARVLVEIGANFRNLELVARREAEHRRRFAGRAATLAEVPWLAEDITDLGGLSRLGEQLRRPVDPSAG
ncbi:MAG: ArsA-related P-loop ATPase [Actinomycetota bacterium]